MLEQSALRCELCYPVNEQTKQILTTLLQIVSQREGCDTEVDQNCADNGGFLGLLKMIFASKYKNYKATTKCFHPILLNSFRSSLYVSEKELNSRCNRIMVKKAKYLYHIDILGSQVIVGQFKVKTINRHFSQGSFHSKKNKEIKNQSPEQTVKAHSPDHKNTPSTIKQQNKMDPNIKTQHILEVTPIFHQLINKQPISFENSIPFNFINQNFSPKNPQQYHFEDKN